MHEWDFVPLLPLLAEFFFKDVTKINGANDVQRCTSFLSQISG
jgi:hypothetical protein